MYTQCPKCKATFRVDIQRLRASRGKVTCRDCQTHFNALDSLAQSAADFPKVRVEKVPKRASYEASAQDEEMELGREEMPRLRASREEAPALRAGSGLIARRHSSPREAEGEPDELPQGSGPGWWLGAFALLALLGWQISVFEGARLAQNERFRPWLELACESLGCELTPYRDTSQIQVIDRALLPAPDDIDGYEFRVIISNQSSLAQAFPSIRLVLSELGGRAIASRTFEPDEYLEPPRAAKMPVGKPFEIRLQLAKPGSEVGGFTFELI